MDVVWTFKRRRNNVFWASCTRSDCVWIFHLFLVPHNQTVVKHQFFTEEVNILCCFFVFVCLVYPVHSMCSWVLGTGWCQLKFLLSSSCRQKAFLRLQRGRLKRNVFQITASCEMGFLIGWKWKSQRLIRLYVNKIVFKTI